MGGGVWGGGIRVGAGGRRWSGSKFFILNVVFLEK